VTSWRCPFHGKKRHGFARGLVTPDYTNQLDLFSEAPIDTPAPVASEPARTSGVSHGRPRPPQQLDFGALEPLPPEDAGPSSGGKNRLQQTLEETAERFTDILYELVSVKKMEYHQAWEIAINEILLPEESSSTNPSTSPPATSG
jgi:hypothetical protein